MVNAALLPIGRLQLIYFTKREAVKSSRQAVSRHHAVKNPLTLTDLKTYTGSIG
jgi:hypothetical protein